MARTTPSKFLLIRMSMGLFLNWRQTIAVLMSLVEGFLFMPMLVAPTGNLSAFIADNVCPLAQLPAPRPYSSSFLIGTIILNVGSIIRVCISIALNFVASEHELITTGPFAVVRHPTHSSLIIAGIGTILIRLHGPLSFCGLFAIHPWIPGLIGAWMAIGIGCMYWLIFHRVNADENELKEAFGEEWETYCKKVRYKLIPGLI